MWPSDSSQPCHDGQLGARMVGGMSPRESRANTPIKSTTANSAVASVQLCKAGTARRTASLRQSRERAD